MTTVEKVFRVIGLTVVGAVLIAMTFRVMGQGCGVAMALGWIAFINSFTNDFRA